MKVTSYRELDDVLQATIKNENETLYYEYRFGLYEDEDVSRIIKYIKKNDDGSNLEVTESHNKDYLWCKYKGSERTVMIDENGYVFGDTIKYIENRKKHKFHNIHLLERVKLKDYIISSPKLFMNEDGAFINDILGDEHFERFLELNEKYGEVLRETVRDTEKEHKELCKKISKKIENRINAIN